MTLPTLYCARCKGELAVRWTTDEIGLVDTRCTCARDDVAIEMYQQDSDDKPADLVGTAGWRK